MNANEISAYVDAAAAAHGLTLGEAERGRVIEQFTRIAALAAPVLDCPLPPDVEIAPVFRP